MPDPNIEQLCDLRLEPVDNNLSAISRDDLDLLVINGDLAVSTGSDVIKASLIRRLNTRLGSYAKDITTYDADKNSTGKLLVVSFDKDYGSKLGFQISESLDNRWIANFINELSSALSGDPRITVVGIDVTVSNPAEGRIGFNVRYTINSSNITDQIDVNTAPGSVSVSAG